MALSDALADVEAIFDRFAAREIAPGAAYGVIVGGALVHSGGRGTLRVGDPAPPDADSVFRIASMTKSFTAAAVLLLRDAGRLRLDDEVATWVPELAGLERATADSPPLTVEHLLTMAAGFPSDDPWGDRQQGLDLAEFATFLGRGPSLAWAPGTHFEYSNLGYGILGRVVTRAGGKEYREFIRERLLGPLGMTSTTFVADEVPPARLAMGYLRRDDAWLEEPIDPYGALASMGGVFTSVRDLSRWVAWFLDAFPARDDPEEAGPLSRASRREMQQLHRPFEPELSWTSADAAPTALVAGYGYGLFISQELRFGRTVGHGGGYPGFGSHMRWHPASGVGVVGFANARYAQVVAAVREAYESLLAAEVAPIRRPVPWPETTEARASVERLLDRWDDDIAAALFAMNVELDEPLDIRRAAIDRLREVHGALRPDESAATESLSPAHLAWWMDGERGRVKVEILLSPERPPRIQALTLTSVPEPPAALTAVAERLAGLLGTPGPSWPSDVPLTETADHSAIERGLRAAEARFGTATLGRPTAGDGAKTATWGLTGDRGALSLTLELDAPGGAVEKATFIPAPMESPVHDA